VKASVVIFLDRKEILVPQSLRRKVVYT